MENQFAQLVQKSAELNWCVRIYCTTCGSMDFRNSLKEITENSGSKLANHLYDLKIEEYTRLQNWDECLRLAFHELGSQSLQTQVLYNWLSSINKNIRFADWNLFYFVRHLPDDSPIKNEWVSKSIYLALDTEDESLIETLIWTLRADIAKFEQLKQVAIAKSLFSSKIKRAMINTENLYISLT